MPLTTIQTTKGNACRCLGEVCCNFMQQGSANSGNHDDKDVPAPYALVRKWEPDYPDHLHICHDHAVMHGYLSRTDGWVALPRLALNMRDIIFGKEAE